MNRRHLVIGTAALAALGFAGATYLPRRAAPPAGDALIRPHSPVLGPADAAVTIVEFLDPSCEACRAFYPIVKQIMDVAPGDIRLVIRYAALHDGSDEAVRILEAARIQDRFTPVMERLFADQPAWAIHGAPDLEKAWTIAAAAGLDLDKARRDARTPAVDAVLAQDAADVKTLDVSGTPTFFVNGKPLPSFGPQQLRDLVLAELKAAGVSPRS